MDFLYLALTTGFFAVTIGLVYFFEILRRPK
jgi:hypothetical protein